MEPAMEPVGLRFPEPGDGPALYAAVRESLAELRPWMAWCGQGYALADAERWIAEQPRARADGAAFEHVIVGGDGRLLGCCGVNQIQALHRAANLGYWVRTSATGRGIATQAGKLLVEWAFAHTDLERLEIVAAVGNRASQAVARRLGAAREGVLRSWLRADGRAHDAVVFGILRADPRPDG